MTGQDALRLDGVAKVFNPGTQDEKWALAGLSLTVPTGQFTTLIGSNGAGKSTLLNVIAGTVRPERGRVYLGEMDVTHLPDHRRAGRVARVFQNPSAGTAANMSIEENLCLAELRGRRRGLFRRGVTKVRRERYRAALAELELGLESRLDDRVGLLSGGQRQSLALLMATLQVPPLLLLDEHTAALDPRTADKVMALTDRIVGEHGLTTLMVTHNMNQAIQHGQRMIMLHEGGVSLDLSGEGKRSLTVGELVARFGRSLRDETLLC